MFIDDKVYGKTEIKEKVLIELIQSGPIQRLKRIHQSGISGYIVPYKKTISRFDHSVGVMILLKKYNATLEEQIAGLLHDVSHTAFSHVIDFVFPNEAHEFHEWHYEKFILNTEIATILKEHRYDPRDFLDVKKFTLLERPVPELCADRIDYFLRDRNGMLGKIGDPDDLLIYLVVCDKEFVFTNEKAALFFAKEYLRQNKLSWYSPEEGYYYIAFANILREALRLKIIEKKDFFTDDESLLKKLKKHVNQKIKEKLANFFKPVKLTFRKTKHSLFIKSKPRFVDPKVLKDGKLFRISELNKRFRENLKKEIYWMKKGFWVSVLSP
ncbi:HD domain-containing protein [Candidatus Roizmanbacteria bacterium]|nr:HD domain-containing protein [Candidatus Roizmanbacteria bacterium]